MSPVLTHYSRYLQAKGCLSIPIIHPSLKEKRRTWMRRFSIYIVYAGSATGCAAFATASSSILVVMDFGRSIGMPRARAQI